MNCLRGKKHLFLTNRVPVAVSVLYVIGRLLLIVTFASGQTQAPLAFPTKSPPTRTPSHIRTGYPTDLLSRSPTKWPLPSNNPTGRPTYTPTPTVSSELHSAEPSNRQTILTNSPTRGSTRDPSASPSVFPANETTFTRDGCPKALVTGRNSIFTSYGLIFYIKAKSRFLSITSLSFQSDVADTLAYRLYTKETDIFLTTIGELNTWETVSSGALAGSGVSTFTKIPEFTFPVLIPPDAMYAFYLTLFTPELRYGAGTVGPTTTPHLFNDDLELIQGMGTLSSSPGDNVALYSGEPRTFSGEIVYALPGLPCEEGRTTTNTTNTPIFPTVPPVLLPTTPLPTTHAPSFSRPILPPTSPPTGNGIRYLPEPELKWKAELERNSTQGQVLQRGNAVVLSPDNELLYVIVSDGRLEVLRTNDGSRWGAYTPEPYQQGWSINCSSGIYFAVKEINGNSTERVGIYAIVDIPPFGDQQQSRVIAILHPHVRHLWTSPPLQGVIAGTPTITRREDYVFVTHNTITDMNSQLGIFTVLVASNGTIHFTETFEEADANETMPYAPLGVVHYPIRGNYIGGESNVDDIVVWGTSADNGRARHGYLRLFQFPSSYLPGVDQLSTISLGPVNWATNAKPTLSDDGTMMFFTARRAEMRGWVDRRFDNNANWDQALDTSEADRSTPLYSAPALSHDGHMLFVASASTSFYSLNTTSGSIIWKINTTSEVLNEARVSPDNLRVYSIQREHGAVQALNSGNGNIYWTSDCSSFEDLPGQNCLGNVVAEFALSSDGLALYYGDVDGKITALRLATLGFPTQVPTHFATFTPTTGKPIETSLPSTAPTTAATVKPSQAPTVIPSQAPTVIPSQAPTVIPSQAPTEQPANGPSPVISTSQPSHLQTATHSPTISPTAVPSGDVFLLPSSAPTDFTGYSDRTGVSEQVGRHDSTRLSNTGRAVLVSFAAFAACVFVILVAIIVVRFHKNRKRGGGTSLQS